MDTINRRTFLKQLAQAAAAVAAVGIFGLLEAEEVEFTGKEYLGQKELLPGEVRIPPGYPEDVAPVMDTGGYVVPDDVADILREAKPRTHFVGKPTKVEISGDGENWIPLEGYTKGIVFVPGLLDDLPSYCGLWPYGKSPLEAEFEVTY